MCAAIFSPILTFLSAPALLNFLQIPPTSNCVLNNWKKLCVWTFVAICGIAIARADDLEFFEKRIRPVLAERCYPCHSANAEKLKGEFLLDSNEGMRKGGASGKPAIVPRNAEASQ